MSGKGGRITVELLSMFCFAFKPPKLNLRRGSLPLS